MIVHILVGAVAACGLFIFCKATELFGGESSQVSSNRRLPYDSDTLLCGFLLSGGAVIGLVVAIVCGQQGVQNVSEYWFISAVVAGVAGCIGPLPLVRHLAKGYLERAQENLDQGAFREAVEDAAEAERMYHDYANKQAARSIKEQAQAARQSEIGIAS